MNQLFIFANYLLFFRVFFMKYRQPFETTVNFQLTSKKVAIETEVTITDQKQKKITLCPFL